MVMGVDIDPRVYMGKSSRSRNFRIKSYEKRYSLRTESFLVLLTVSSIQRSMESFCSSANLRISNRWFPVVCLSVETRIYPQQLPLYPKDPIRPMSAGSLGAHFVPQESRLTPPAHRESQHGVIPWNFWPPLG